MKQRSRFLLLSLAIFTSACTPGTDAADAREHATAAERAAATASAAASPGASPAPSPPAPPDCAEPVVEVTEVRYTNIAYDEAADAHHSTAPTGFTMRITNASAHAIKPYAYDFSINLTPSPEVVPTGRAKDWKQPMPFTNFTINETVVEPGDHLDENTSLSDWDALGVLSGKPIVEPTKIYYEYEDTHWNTVCGVQDITD